MPMFVFYIVPGTNGNISIGFLCVSLMYLLIITFKFDKFKYFLAKIFKLPIVRYYFYFIAFIIFTTIINIFSGNYNAPASFYITRIYKVFYALCLIYFLPVFSILLNIKKENLVKFFYSSIYILFLLCIVQFLAFNFNIDFLSQIFHFFTNGRAGMYAVIDDYQNLGRVYAFFSEPSALGQFIFIIMPFITILSKSKYKIYNNVIINRIVKTTAIPLMLLILILTKSPIYLLLCLFEFLTLWIIMHKIIIKRYWQQILSILLIIILCTYILYAIFHHSIEQSYLARILNTISSLGNFNTFILVEPSLATRIVSYSIQIAAFTKQWLIGCGLYNAEIFVNPIYIQISPLPLTPENYMSHFAYKSYWTGLNRSVVYTSLLEFGVIGFSIYSVFIYKTIKYISNIKRYYNGLNSDFIYATKYSIIFITIISFYNLFIEAAYIWFIFGLICLYTYNFHLQERGKHEKI